MKLWQGWACDCRQYQHLSTNLTHPAPKRSSTGSSSRGQAAADLHVVAVAVLTLRTGPLEAGSKLGVLELFGMPSGRLEAASSDCLFKGTKWCVRTIMRFVFPPAPCTRTSTRPPSSTSGEQTSPVAPFSSLRPRRLVSMTWSPAIGTSYLSAWVTLNEYGGSISPNLALTKCQAHCPDASAKFHPYAQDSAFVQAMKK
eukprot:CAMPEP_0194767562 /NCGR_PEP_ID=MMETSP0323_2-20130528/36368_1 /TAXON_ID=2866 ORGANISM="Crypthecodinium cohnii, Strain Seligo" /NCGR_SAMPLE_ID=MMETSP0323_2 /ASSEMBLY_ACC=CAM_ASM_000346 /LENGTH=198 /DNA_ID=CAMNT_0039699373 /DNA_START=30 /DNA_END=628 /DNA_ORIENTATION=-